MAKEKTMKIDTRPLDEQVEKQESVGTVDKPLVLSQAEYKRRISKLKISSEIEAFRKTHRRGDK